MFLFKVKLPSGFPASASMASLSSTSSKHAVTIAAIHHYRDMAAAALESQSTILAAELPCQAADQPLPSDFNTASDRLDASFQQLRRWLDQLGAAARNLQSCDGESNTLRRFSSEQCRDIDILEKEAVMAKMGELSLRNCSIQSRKPVRSLGHTLDLQEIMLLAKNAKSLVYEVVQCSVCFPNSYTRYYLGKSANAEGCRPCEGGGDSRDNVLPQADQGEQRVAASLLLLPQAQDPPTVAGGTVYQSVIIHFYRSIIVTSCNFYVLAPYVKKHHNQKEYWRIQRNIYREKVLLCIFQTSSIPLKLTLERLPRYIALAEASLSSI